MSTAVPSHDELTPLPPSHEQKLLPEHATESDPPKRGGARLWIVLLIILLIIGAVIYVIHKNNAATQAENTRSNAAGDRAVPVQVAPVEQKAMPIYLQTLGTVTAYNTVTIKTRVDGQLLNVNFREGQAVHKGDLLLQIDPRPYKAAVDQAEGQLARDQAQAAYARAEAQRYAALFEAGVVSKESQQTQQSTAGQLEGTLKADEAAIEAAKVNLAYTRITSPIDGVVGLRQVDPGNIVHASDSTGLIIITQLQPISVIFTVAEDHLPNILKSLHAGQHLPVEAWDRGNTTKLATGSLLTMDNQIDQTTGTDRLKAVFDNRDSALFPNQFVNARLITETRQNAIVIPAAALNSGSQGNFVYVMRAGDPPASLRGAGGGGGRGGGRRGGGAAPAGDGAAAPAAGDAPAGGGRRGGGAGGDAAAANQPHYWAEAVPVKVDTTEGTQVILLSGVNAGDQLVVDGQEKLKNGSRVTPRKGVAGNAVQSATVGGADTTEHDASQDVGPAAAQGGAQGAGKHGAHGAATPAGSGAGAPAPAAGGQHNGHGNGQGKGHQQ